jgi:hypothetical protein
MKGEAMKHTTPKRRSAVGSCARYASGWRAGTAPRRFSRSQGGTPLADFSSLLGPSGGWTARARGPAEEVIVFH